MKTDYLTRSEELIKTTSFPESIFRSERLKIRVSETRHILETIFKIDDLSLADIILIQKIEKDTMEQVDLELNLTDMEHYILGCEGAIRFLELSIGIDFTKEPYNLKPSALQDEIVIRDLTEKKEYYFRLTETEMRKRLRQELTEKNHDFEYDFRISREVLDKIQEERYWQTTGSCI